LEDKPPVLFDLRFQLGIVDKGVTIGHQTLRCLVLVQFERQHADFEQVLLELAGSLLTKMSYLPTR
jgi:hypothetical protein